MPKITEQKISAVAPGSIGAELGLVPGDVLLSINGKNIEDVLDYRFLIQNAEVDLVIRHADGTEEEWDVEKDPFDDLGLEFESGLMSEYRRCSNQCIFCFIDQMPPGMRETLYFKDDDARLSFLQGNYITMTNMKKKDLERIIRYRLSPINVSVHTTNPELRRKMLHNRFAGNILENLRTLADGGIEMNGQIVLCPQINDGEELAGTLRDLAGFYPRMQSVSVVPVGITKYRKGLYPLRVLTRQEAADAVDLIEDMQRRMWDRYGTHFVHASDEFYLMAGRELPEEERYDGYPQLENGVGMIRLLRTEAQKALSELPGDGRRHVLSAATGQLAWPTIRRIADEVQKKFPGIVIHVYPIRNDFFGETITVAGLVTGRDIAAQLAGKELGEKLLLPAEMFRSGEEVFLDGMTRGGLERALQVPVVIVKSEGQKLVKAFACEPSEEQAGQLHSPYEL
ncbi:MAG: DUF512 domain-containing protein [Lachnospiraceae bacterium]|jgi:putative radical SAM enzyme (TIGR03279 family)